MLQIRCATGDWAGALDMLERNRAAGALDRASYRRQRAVLLTARALATEDSDRGTSQALVFEAVKLAPDLVPAVALAARYLAESGDLRKATRMIERAWQTIPHPDLAETYAYLRFGDSARDRLAPRAPAVRRLRRTISRARWRLRAPPSMHANSPRRAARSSRSSRNRRSAWRC